LFELGIVALIREDWARARSYFQQSLEIWRRFDDQTGLAISVNGLAWVASAQGQARRAARLSGAAAFLREDTGIGLWGIHRAVDDKSMSRAKTMLGDAGWDVGWAEGHAMPPTRAVAYALEEDAS
jgi:hypothetical protein